MPTSPLGYLFWLSPIQAHSGGQKHGDIKQRMLPELHHRTKFIVVADSMREAIEMAWEHGGAEFHGMFDKATAQATEMKQGALRVL